MRDLAEIRKEIDRVDREILTLFSQRMELSEQVAAYKIAHDLPVLDAGREKEKLAALSELAETEEEQEAVRALFTEIMRLSRAHQETILARQ